MKHRVTLDLTGEAFDQLADLARKTSNGQKATACRTAIRVYHELVEAKRDGLQIRLHDPNTGQHQNVILVGA